MISLCLDTNVYSAHYKADPVAVALVAAVAQIWLPAIVVGELRAGFLNGSKSAANELHLQEFLALPYLAVANVTEVTSRHFAKVSQQLRRDGRPIPTNDIWIAATAMEHGIPLFTHDKHFCNVIGLQVVRNQEDWLQLHI
jgi:tRNA(fMet)-specific endonuclease VapC